MTSVSGLSYNNCGQLQFFVLLTATANVLVPEMKLHRFISNFNGIGLFTCKDIAFGSPFISPAERGYTILIFQQMTQGNPPLVTCRVRQH
jgi:hypothetical protein